MANMLSLLQVSQSFRVTMDMVVDPAILVHVGNDDVIKFNKCRSGLYYYDTSNSYNSTLMGYSFLAMVKSNKEYFSRREIEGADKAHILQGNIG